MKDDVIELLNPELLKKYRRWRPRFTVTIAVAGLMFVLSQVIAVIDSGNSSHPFYWFAKGLYYAGLVTYVAVILVERRMTRGISDLGPLFSTRTRWLVTGFCVLGLGTAFATLNTVYDGF